MGSPCVGTSSRVGERAQLGDVATLDSCGIEWSDELPVQGVTVRLVRLVVRK